MRSIIATLLLAAFSAVPVNADVILTGVVDGPLPGGLPKAFELFVVNDIADLSTISVGSANNGGGSDGEEFTLSGSASAGDFLYVTSNAAGFQDFFGFAADFVDDAANVNGDDAVEVFQNGVVIDTFGDINTDGTGEAWEYLDGWAYRASDTTADGDTFDIANWLFSGINALDGETTNASAANAFPIGTFTLSSTTVPEPSSIALIGVIGLSSIARRRRR